MKIEIDCSKVQIGHNEYRAFLFQLYYSSQSYILKLLVLLLFSSIISVFWEFSFDDRLLDNLLTAGKMVAGWAVVIWVFCPPALFRFKKALDKYCREGYNFSLSDSSFAVIGNRVKLDMAWESLQKVRMKGEALIFRSRYGDFLLSKSWLEGDDCSQLKALLNAKGIKNNLS